MEELDLKEIFELLWNKKIQIILIILIFIGIGVIYTVGFTTPKYTSSTTLVLATEQEADKSKSDTSITTTDITLNSKLISTYSELVKSKNVLRKVISNLNIDISEDYLRGNVSVKSVSDTELIKISVTNENPEIAAEIANEIAIVFTEQVKEIYKINNVHVVDVAEVESNPSNINHTKDLIIFAFIGLVVSFIYIFIDNMLDTTVKSVEEIEKQFAVPVLATIPLCNFDSKKGGRK